jgi:hypothetical protein
MTSGVPEMQEPAASAHAHQERISGGTDGVDAALMRR